MKVITQHHIGTTEEWKKENPKLYEAVLGFEKTADGKVFAKLGNGIDKWNNLKYFDMENIKGLTEKFQGIFTEVQETVRQTAEQILPEVFEEEVQARKEADSALAQAITEEAQAREKSDQALHKKIATGVKEIIKFGRYLRKNLLQEKQERQKEDHALREAVEAAKNYTDDEIAGALTASQKWLPAVDTLAVLQEIEITDTSRSWLCRVREEQAIYQYVAGQTEWELYSDNNDFINEDELEAAVNGHNENGEAHADIRQGIAELDERLTAVMPEGLDNLPDLLAQKAPIDNPVFTGIPKIPSKTSVPGNEGTLIATEAQLFSVMEKLSKASGLYFHKQKFTEDGEFVVPEGVTKIYVTACGAGGGGSVISDGASFPKTYGGGGAACVIKREFAVIPGQVIQITIGAPGIGGEAVSNGGIYGTTAATSGGATILGGLVTLAGGGGAAGSAGASGGTGGGKGGADGANGTSGKGCSASQGGVINTNGGGGSLGGGGAGGTTYSQLGQALFGETSPAAGGVGQNPNVSELLDDAVNGQASRSYSGGDGSYGAGGGSSGYVPTCSAGNGGPGVAVIEW